jgi:NCS1 family nucleobase:cation symporter-1
MSWWQALVTILLGNTIVLAPILLNSHPGTKYGIPFPVFARAAYGTLGSNLPALMRALGGLRLVRHPGLDRWRGPANVVREPHPGWASLLGSGFQGHTTTEWLSFLLFWGLNIWIIYEGMDVLRIVENWAAPFVLVMTGALVVWAVREAHGSDPSSRSPGSSGPSASSCPSSSRRSPP